MLAWAFIQLFIDEKISRTREMNNEHKRVMSHNIYLYSRFPSKIYKLLWCLSLRYVNSCKKLGAMMCYISMFIHQYLALI